MPDDRPQVSVIIPCYNSADFIAETLDSVFAQTYKNFETVLVNDGSANTDVLEKVINPYRDKLIYLKQENGGVSKARNTGIKASRGSLLAFLDSDDIWEPSFLESQIKFLCENDLDLVYCDALLFGESPLAGKTYMQCCPSEGKVSLKSLMELQCNIITSCVVVRKEIVRKVGMFDEQIKVAEDFDLWARILQADGKINYRTDIDAKHRVRETGLSGNAVQSLEMAISAFDNLRRKIVLSSDEEVIVRLQSAKLKAQWYLEKGKENLLDDDFDEAWENFKAAGKNIRGLKRATVILMMRISPSLVKYIFLRYRKRNANLNLAGKI